MVRATTLFFLLSSLSGAVLAQDDAGQAQEQFPEDPNSLVGSTVKLSPQMRVMPREDPDSRQQQEMKEMRDLLREYNRGSIRSKPLE